MKYFKTFYLGQIVEFLDWITHDLGGGGVDRVLRQEKKDCNKPIHSFCGLLWGRDNGDGEGGDRKIYDDEDDDCDDEGGCGLTYTSIDLIGIRNEKGTVPTLDNGYWILGFWLFWREVMMREERELPRGPGNIIFQV